MTKTFAMAAAAAAMTLSSFASAAPASDGLIQLATTGNPAGLHMELGGEIVESSTLAATVGQASLNSLLNVAEDEHLAPKALMVDGVLYAMVAPTITKDNFIKIEDGVAQRIDVGASEGTNEPFVVAESDPSALPEFVQGTASEGLIQIATTGNPAGLHAEVGGEIVSSDLIDASSILDLANDEHLAPKAVSVNGYLIAMVAPTITKDNFVVVTPSGDVVRMDVGATEGTNMPFQVAEIVSDGGTPWYVELWYFITRA